MKKAVLAVIAACLGCCALLLLIPALSGVTVLGLGFAGGLSLETVLCGLPVAVLLAWGIYVLIRRTRRKTCAHNGSCGCKPADPQAR